MEPIDPFDETLEQNIRPRNWPTPTPTDRYNLVVIGAGAAGLVTAVGAAGLGAKVALIERNSLGGDCLNSGCVPSKALIKSSRVASGVQGARQFGVKISGQPTVNFPTAMRRMRRLRSEISSNDAAERFRNLGIDVFFGQGQFLNSETIEVAGQRLQFAKAVIATGARAAAPPIPGLDSVPYLTNETLFSLGQLPTRMGVIGAGPIGCEMAQTFARFGSRVFLVESMHGILPREDPDAARCVRDSLGRDGVTLLCCGKELKVSRAGEAIRLQVNSHGSSYDETVDTLLVAVGRAPNVEGLGLDAVDVVFDAKGVQVNDRLRTTNPRIFAAGDICSPYQFTHAADFMARIVIQNALFLGRARASALTIPWCTYTSPELAHVGLSATTAEQQNIAVDTFTQALGEVDRAVLDGEKDGFCRIHVRKGTDRIVGATLVASNAGDMISEITVVMQHGIGLKKLASTIHPYPTQAEVIRKVGDQYNRTRLTPRIKRLMANWFSWTR